MVHANAAWVPVEERRWPHGSTSERIYIEREKRLAGRELGTVSEIKKVLSDLQSSPVPIRAPGFETTSRSEGRAGCCRRKSAALRRNSRKALPDPRPSSLHCGQATAAHRKCLVSRRATAKYPNSAGRREGS